MIIINKFIGIGRLTKDPEIRFTPGSGTAVLRFSLAITRPFKKEETDFINCVAFGKTAETITQYFTKGSPIAITGRIQTGSYEAQDGTKRYTTDVIVENFEFISGGKKSENNNNNDFGDNSFGNNSFGDNSFGEPAFGEDTPW